MYETELPLGWSGARLLLYHPCYLVFVLLFAHFHPINITPQLLAITENIKWYCCVALILQGTDRHILLLKISCNPLKTNPSVTFRLLGLFVLKQQSNWDTPTAAAWGGPPPEASTATQCTMVQPGWAGSTLSCWPSPAHPKHPQLTDKTDAWQQADQGQGPALPNRICLHTHDRL